MVATGKWGRGGFESFASFASGSEGASRLFCQGPVLGHTPRTPAVHRPCARPGAGHGPRTCQLPEEVPRRGLARPPCLGGSGSAGCLAARSAAATAVPGRDSPATVAASRGPWPARRNRAPEPALPQAERLGRATVTSRKRSLRRAATVSRDSAGLRKAIRNAKRV